jgi:hypothetical protein
MTVMGVLPLAPGARWIRGVANRRSFERCRVAAPRSNQLHPDLGAEETMTALSGRDLIA